MEGGVILASQLQVFKATSHASSSTDLCISAFALSIESGLEDLLHTFPIKYKSLKNVASFWSLQGRSWGEGLDGSDEPFFQK